MRKLKRMMQSIIFMLKQKEILLVPKIVDREKLLKGRVALITGGSSGIGLEIAKEFLKNGCKVIIAGTNEEKLKLCCKNLENKNIKYITLNLTEINTFEEKFKQILNLFPNDKIDILVNSAGVTGFTNYFEVTEKEYDNIMNINVKGNFFLSQIFSKYMIRNNIKGNILNISSSSAVRPAWQPYQISKWGIKGFTLGLADTLAPYGIVVNALAPGPVLTPMLGKNEGDNLYNSQIYNKRYTLPCEIAYLATYMVSDFGRLIIGDTVYSAGGSGILDLRK